MLSHRAMQTSAKREAEETPMMPFQQGWELPAAFAHVVDAIC
jgi:hypothetical protein